MMERCVDLVIVSSLVSILAVSSLAIILVVSSLEIILVISLVTLLLVVSTHAPEDHLSNGPHSLMFLVNVTTAG